MDELRYTFALAFSGADLPRAVVLAVGASLFCSSKISTSRMTVAVFLADRAWPFVHMGISGYGAPEIARALSYAAWSAPADFVAYLVRFCGLYALITIGYRLRVGLHRIIPGGSRLTAPY